MLLDFPLPEGCSLRTTDVHEEDQIITVGISSRCHTSACPDCGTPSGRVHSSCERHPADLPVSGHSVRLRVTARRFFCDHDICARTTFAERMPGFLQPYARRTDRLGQQQLWVGFVVGGKAGSRLLALLAMRVSGDTLLRMIRRAPEPYVPTPRILGIDDWAKRKGRDYGTILVDLEARQPVDMLPEATSEAVATWLREHPGVEIVSRDRGPEFIKGVQEGAPDAIPVADRWHLMKNLREAIERWLDGKRACLKAAAGAIEDADPKTETAEPGPDIPKTRGVMTPGHERRLARYDAVMSLYGEGLSQVQIARRLSLSRKTVRRYICSDGCPLPTRRTPRPGKLDPYKPYIRERWSSGCRHAITILREIRAMGYRGGYSILTAWMTSNLRHSSTRSGAAPKRRLPWSPRRAAWLLMRDEADLSDDDSQALDRMIQVDIQVRDVHDLTHRFLNMVREGRSGDLMAWIDDAGELGIASFRGFAGGLMQDLDAVRNALALPWSNGQVEGQINRLKLIKRQMYGRAGFDLLRKRVLCQPPAA